MLSKRDPYTEHLLLLLALFLFPVGLLFAPYLLSVCMISCAVLALFRIDLTLKYWIQIRPGLKTNFSLFLKRPEFWSLIIFYIIVFWGFWNIEDPSYWMSRLRIKLPFLILPISFFLMPQLEVKEIKGLFYSLLIMVSLTCIGVFINYLLHFEAINLMIKQGQSMPLPCNHIRFSLLLALCVLLAFYLYLENYYWFGKWEKWLQLGIGIFLFAFIHFLSVRSGLVVIYLTLGLLIMRFIFTSKKYFLGIGLILLMGLFPIIAYYTMPSLQTKVGYVKYDLYMYQKGEADTQLSDAGRWISLQIGWDVFKQAPLLGVGPGNLKKEVSSRYTNWYPNIPVENQKMPHNQFLTALAGLGLLGIPLFLFAFFAPFFFNKNYKHWLFLGFYSIIFLSFMVENTIENAMGVGFFLYFLLLFLLLINSSQVEAILSNPKEFR